MSSAPALSPLSRRASLAFVSFTMRTRRMVRPRVVPQPNKNSQLSKNRPTPLPYVSPCLFFGIVQPSCPALTEERMTAFDPKRTFRKMQDVPTDNGESPHTYVDLRKNGPARWGFPATGPEMHGYFSSVPVKLDFGARSCGCTE
jgi:hypothetical protein